MQLIVIHPHIRSYVCCYVTLAEHLNYCSSDLYHVDANHSDGSLTGNASKVCLHVYLQVSN